MTYLEYLSKNLKLNGCFLEFENFYFESKILARTIEIDAISKDEDKILIAETKFSINKRTLKDYKDMLDDLKAEIFRPYKNIELYLFGANGFDDKIKDIKNEHLHLIDLDDMFSK